MALTHLLTCPICSLPLSAVGNTFTCAKAHSFDIAREGYVNLLRKKLPGDTKEMLAARRQFLEQGYYQPLSDQLNELVYAHLPTSVPKVLDAGCGEGYYLGRLQRFLAEKQPAAQGAYLSSNNSAGADYAVSLINQDMQPPSAGTDLSCPREPAEGLPGHDKSVPAEVSRLFISSALSCPPLHTPGSSTDTINRPLQSSFVGVDISKEAIRLAARRYRECCFVVSNLKERFVFADGTLDILLNIFAPHNVQEFVRVMAPGGLLMLVIPGPAHLLQLRQELHLLNIEEQKQLRVMEQFARSFKLLTTATLHYTLHLDNTAISQLVMMTPNFWHLSSEVRQAMVSIDELQTEVEFICMLWLHG